MIARSKYTVDAGWAQPYEASFKKALKCEKKIK